MPLKLASEALASLTGTAVSRLREVMGHVAVALLGTVVSAMEQVNGSDDVSEMLRALLFVDVLEQVCALCSALASVTGLRDFQFAPRVAETDGGAIVLRDPVSAFRAGTLDMETNPAGLRLDLADYRMTARRLLEQGGYPPSLEDGLAHLASRDWAFALTGLRNHRKSASRLEQLRLVDHEGIALEVSTREASI